RLLVLREGARRERGLVAGLGVVLVHGWRSVRDLSRVGELAPAEGSQLLLALLGRLLVPAAYVDGRRGVLETRLLHAARDFLLAFEGPPHVPRVDAVAELGSHLLTERLKGDLLLGRARASPEGREGDERDAEMRRAATSRPHDRVVRRGR